MVLAQPENQENKCEFDQFIVTGGAPIPAICGTNTGAHSKWRFDQFIVTGGAPIPAIGGLISLP
jgi:hypothetical protein